MNDNAIRAFRTALQAVAGFAATGGLDLVWKNFLSTHNANLDPTLLLVIGLLLTGVASFAHNYLEDATGKTLGPVPTDRTIGDKTLGTGVGAKT